MVQNFRVATSLAPMSTTPRPHTTNRPRSASRRALVAGILTTTALAFTACSSQNDEAANDSVATETTTVIQTGDAASSANSADMPNPADSDSDATTAEDGEKATGDTESTSSSSSENTDLRQALVDEVYNNPSPGTKFMVGDEELTVCVYGDGYGTNLVVAGPNTSCDFATEVFNKQTEGLNATHDNIRDNLQPNIQATSSATGKTYDVSCGTQSDGVVVCTGGDNAKIYIN